MAEGEISGVRSEIREQPIQVQVRCDRPSAMAARVFETDHVVEVKLHVDGGGLLIKTRDADKFYRLLNHIALDGIVIESVTPADDNANSIYEYLIGGEVDQMNWGLWWAQIRSVIRLEMRKTFFAKRGIWVYLLALAPAALFFLDSIGVIHDRDRRVEEASTHQVSREALQGIKMGMSRDEVEAKLGEPYSRQTFTFGGRREQHEQTTYRYTDGENDYLFFFRDDELRGRGENEIRSIPKDSLIFASVFQLFFLRLAIFFGCVGIFTNLFRGELLDKSLHFYLLAPIRREVLLVRGNIWRA